MDRLATTFTEFRSASILAVALQRGGYSNEGFEGFNDSGFHRDYTEKLSVAYLTLLLIRNSLMVSFDPTT